jgi:group I intron endonuclease
MESRAEAKRRYKETPAQAGIFLITNTANGKVLLGSSTNLHGPLNKHRFSLTTGRHPIPKLQEDWNRFGAAAFTFEVVEVLKVKEDPEFNLSNELELLEQVWIDKTQPFGERGYNVQKSIRE